MKRSKNTKANTVNTVNTANKVKLSLTQRHEILLASEKKTSFDFVKLANLTDKIEDKSISKVYSRVVSSIYLNDILGGSKLPTFKEFTEKMPIKEFYSNWDGYKNLLKFNKSHQQTAKANRQNLATAAK